MVVEQIGVVYSSKLGLLAWMLAVSWPQWLSYLASAQFVGAPLHPPFDLPRFKYLGSTQLVGSSLHSPAVLPHLNLWKASLLSFEGGRALAN